ncbi:MAG: M4 family metallopeptidase, partial [Bacteroidota bacterium]
SYDGAGAPINVYVHFGVNVTNAFFNFAGIAFGDGGAGTDPLTTIDVVTHELGHGVSATTADFDSQKEPGALNESFSDIFGTAVEFQTLGNAGADWIIASEIGPAIRNMEDPNALNDPDTYGGLNWIEQEGCNPSPFNNQCGIHINAGVQNFWFYLLVNGGTGTNDIGDAYSVTGIGMDKAADIAYRNLTTYLTSTSGFFDARFYSIQSALDLFGACSPEVEATTRAWHAVGVGPDYLPFVQSGFTADNTRECESPFPVAFSQNSSNATSFAWDFGDGNTSTMPNPTHVYTGTGEFDVTLIVSSSCGADTLARPAYVQVLPPAVPTAADAQICEDSTATLGASTPFGGIFRWYDSASGGNLLHVGDSFTTPPLTVSTTYYVQNDQFNSGIPLGPADSTLGPATTDNGSNGLVFTLFDTQELASVKVFAQGAGPRTIEVRDDMGTLLDARTVDLMDGEQRVPLNFLLPTGGNYELRATGSNINLGYNIGGANYPYIEIGRGAITRSTDTINPTSAYHYFYDWELRDVCSSDREAVTVNVCPVGTQELLSNWQLSVFPNPADDQVQLSLNPERDAVVQVWLTDLHGRLAGTQLRRSLRAGQQYVVVPVAGLAEGLYLLHLETDRGKLVRKLAIMR